MYALFCTTCQDTEKDMTEKILMASLIFPGYLLAQINPA